MDVASLSSVTRRLAALELLANKDSDRVLVLEKRVDEMKTNFNAVTHSHIVSDGINLPVTIDNVSGNVQICDLAANTATAKVAPAAGHTNYFIGNQLAGYTGDRVTFNSTGVYENVRLRVSNDLAAYAGLSTFTMRIRRDISLNMYVSLQKADFTVISQVIVAAALAADDEIAVTLTAEQGSQVRHIVIQPATNRYVDYLGATIALGSVSVAGTPLAL